MGKKGRREKLSPLQFDLESYDDTDIDLDISLPTSDPKNQNQRNYTRMLYGMKPMIFAIGPAGTGKTMLACHAGIHGLCDNSFKKIVITRPAVSVEEDIGYLPGTLEEKMDPWTRPIMDIFFEFYSQSQINHMLREKIIEICPLAFMRGRTFKHAFIIADEMQNSTPNQMKMLLTRIGYESKIVVTGDLHQHDRKYENNGLKDIFDRIKNNLSSRIEYILFNHEDIERSPVVKDVLKIYGDLKE